MEPPFLRRFAERTIELMGGHYRELVDRRDTILQIVHSEEERFNRTLDQGLLLVEEEIVRAQEASSVVFPAAVAFQLHDTYGFPIEVTREIVEERGLQLNLDEFDSAMDQQRNRARHAQRGDDSYQDAVTRFARETVKGTEFKGYEREDLFTVLENLKPLDDERVLLALRESPFYAEMGGQVADTGIVESESGKVEVLDVQLHGHVEVIVGRVLEGRLDPGTRVKATLFSSYRHDVAANHTATHSTTLCAPNSETRSRRQVPQCGRTSCASTSLTMSLSDRPGWPKSRIWSTAASSKITRFASSLPARTTPAIWAPRRSLEKSTGILSG
jgi:alanyl-tRNA synthetase